jgi:ATP-binding cassette subfamily C protein LapB
MQFPLRRAVMQAYQEGIERKSFLTETVTGLESIKGGNAQNAFQRRMENMIREASDRVVKSHWYSLLGTSTTTWLIHLATIFLVIGCVYRVFEGSMTMGGVIACVILTSRAMAPLTMVTGLMTRFQQTMSSLRGLNQVMSLPREYGGGRKFTRKEDFRPDIELKNVIVRYPGQSIPALNDVSIHIKPGERVGIIGPVGSGKSTLLKLLVKLYEQEEGEVLIDGMELSQYHPVMLRRHIGYMPQEPTIFHGTLRDNVAFGAPWINDAEVTEAIRMAGLMAFIHHNPLGMHTPVGEQGLCLSGGQREAIALARCFLRKPKLLLLDEPTASMDAVTEQEVIANLEDYLKQDEDRTLLLSTHKLHLLKMVDRVILLDHGKVVPEGSSLQMMTRLQGKQVVQKKPIERGKRNNPE